MSMFSYDANSVAVLLLFSTILFLLLSLIRLNVFKFAGSYLKAICAAVLLFTFGQAQAQSDWVGWPSADERDGRFLSVTGPLSAIDYVAPNIIIGIPESATTFDIEIFDGDASDRFE